MRFFVGLAQFLLDKCDKKAIAKNHFTDRANARLIVKMVSL